MAAGNRRRGRSFSVLWQNPYDRSTELCRLSELDAGFSLEGVVLAPAEDEPARVGYRVDADQGWNTLRARIRVEAATWARRLELTRERDRWLIDGRHQPSLAGCTDVDLRVTPATNTLAIRRLGLDVGGAARVRAAWVGFPQLEVQPSEQAYERLSEDTYRYRSGDFTADLLVDQAGMVARYGDEYWRKVAPA